jgi:hypothetical protein
MKVEDLKLYGKYKDISDPNRKFIYIGVDNEGFYWFLLKYESSNTSFSFLKDYGLDPDKIVKHLNLETFIDEEGREFIKGYDRYYFITGYVEKYLEPLSKNDQTEENKQELATTILQAVMNEDWAYMLTLFPEGVEYKGTCNTVDHFDDWDTYDTFARYTHPAQKMLKDKCLSKVLDLMSNK